MNGRFVHLMPGLAAASLALFGAGCVVTVDAGRYSTRQDKQWTVTGTPEVTLVTFDGSIEVRSWDKAEVRVEVEKRAGDKALADKIEVVMEQAGNTITVEAKKPAAMESLFGLKVSPTARMVAMVPRRCNLVARSGDGSISLERIEGRIELNTGDGSLSGEALAGTLRAHSGDGSIRFEDIQGSVDIDTGDGGGELNGRLTAVKLRTGDGTVAVRAEDGSAMSDDWEIRTGDGGVRLELPDGFAANLDADSGDGRVTVHGFGDPDSSGGEDDSHGALRRPLNGGGRQLRLRTGSGTISVRTL
jgi:hypothetical protein